MKKYYKSLYDKRIIGICFILITEDDLTQLSDIKNLLNVSNELETFLSEH